MTKNKVKKVNKIMSQMYQGDIVRLKIKKPLGKVSFQPLPKQGLVVAEGEVTGHKHLLVAEPESLIDFGRDEHGWYIKVKKGRAKLTHNIHKPLMLTEGLWFIGGQFEYSEIEKLRRVQD